MQAIKAVRNGRTVANLADAFGVNERTLYRWLLRYAEGGQKALRSKPKSRRPRKLTPEEMRWVARTVRDGNPQQLKMPYALWTLSLIQELIERHLGKSLSRASVHNLMKTLGFSAQKPLYQAWQRDPELVRQWESETCPKIRKQAKRGGRRSTSPTSGHGTRTTTPAPLGRLLARPRSWKPPAGVLR